IRSIFERFHGSSIYLTEIVKQRRVVARGILCPLRNALFEESHRSAGHSKSKIRKFMWRVVDVLLHGFDHRRNAVQAADNRTQTVSLGREVPLHQIVNRAARDED